MAEGLQTPEGEAVKLDPAAVEQEFARAMADPAPGEENKPPKRSKPADGEKKPAPRRGRPPKADRPKATGKAAPKPQSDSERAEGVRGLVQIGAGLCMVLDQRTAPENIAFKADAVTLANAAEPISQAVVETAKHNASFAAVVDKITAAGPYAALISVGISVGAQIAANHGVQAAKMMGANDPKDLVAAVEAQAQDQQAA